MQDELDITKKRLSELAHRAFSQERYAFSEFLTLAEQDALSKMKREDNFAPYTLQGGFPGAERKLAFFGSAQICGYEVAPPVVCVEARPIAPKFADALTHRDFLGALMSLGVRRSVLGDIVISDNTAYIICLETIAGFIAQELTQVRHTAVKCKALGEIPAVLAPTPEESRINIASERLDAVISAVYKLSRSDGSALFEQGKVYVNSTLCENVSHEPSAEDIISVRGYGRFIYDGVISQTRKGRLAVSVRIFR